MYRRITIGIEINGISAGTNLAVKHFFLIDIIYIHLCEFCIYPIYRIPLFSISIQWITRDRNHSQNPAVDVIGTFVASMVVKCKFPKIFPPVSRCESSFDDDSPVRFGNNTGWRIARKSLLKMNGPFERRLDRLPIRLRVTQ